MSNETSLTDKEIAELVRKALEPWRPTELVEYEISTSHGNPVKIIVERGNEGRW